MSVRLGIAGLGPMGLDLLREGLRCPDAEVVGVCDPDAAGLARGVEVAGSGVQGFASYEVMLAAGLVDGVIIATPPALHADMAVAAFEKGIHVFCEKPMALNVGDCRRMIAAGARAQRVLMVGHVLRYIGIYRYLLDVIRSGELGRPRAMRTLRTMNHWGAWERPWRLSQAMAGGMLYEVNIHEIDLMRCILGEPEWVVAAGGRLINHRVEYEDWVTVHLGFADGALGSVTSAQCDYLGQNSGEIFCERGTIYYDSVSSAVRIGTPDGENMCTAYNALMDGVESGVARELREFVEAVRGTGPVTIPGEEGLRNVEVVEAAYRSVREGVRIGLPLD